MGTGLFPAGFSPIQKTVVTISLFHGKLGPGCGRAADNNCPGENAIELTSVKRSSDDLCDFLLAFILAGSAFDVVACAKREEIDDRITAIV